jgi:hypothetical protein
VGALSAHGYLEGFLRNFIKVCSFLVDLPVTSSRGLLCELLYTSLLFAETLGIMFCLSTSGLAIRPGGRLASVSSFPVASSPRCAPQLHAPCWWAVFTAQPAAYWWDSASGRWGKLPLVELKPAEAGILFSLSDDPWIKLEEENHMVKVP